MLLFSNIPALVTLASLRSFKSPQKKKKLVSAIEAIQSVLNELEKSKHFFAYENTTKFKHTHIQPPRPECGEMNTFTLVGILTGVDF